MEAVSKPAGKDRWADSDSDEDEDGGGKGKVRGFACERGAEVVTHGSRGGLCRRLVVVVVGIIKVGGVSCVQEFDDRVVA